MDYEKIISEQAAKIEQLTKLLEQALLRIAELESQLNQNSRNSSKPPSSDPYKKQPGLPGKKGKKGGQKGHKGLLSGDLPAPCCSRWVKALKKAVC